MAAAATERRNVKALLNTDFKSSFDNLNGFHTSRLVELCP
jgi:hypothetical protein